ncbi:pseudouridine synthase [Sneathiella glossodoripedis]|uniref:pseudouridine synthase n=1 Tax=Sneathiella glossodoripedis TaxID=418853 RepID=UPI00046FAAC5|nr:pseudouridine synthase [Sneathiella glossodoripedis]
MTEETSKKERIAKRIARAGLCSRRDAERWIEEGRVSLNGKILTSPAVTVDDTDKIIVDGNPLPEKERPRLWRYHKPAGLVTSHRDEKGRDTVFDKLPEDMPRVISVGRLDLNSEGLLLLTNDGELARRLELPATGWKRKYRVRVHGHPKEHELQKLAAGVTIEGIRYGSIEAVLDSTKGANSWLTISIREGKNREVRKVMDHLGYPVLRLIRVSYGPLQLGELEEGAVDEVKSKILRDQMGVEKFEEPAKPAPPKSRKPSLQGKDKATRQPKQARSGSIKPSGKAAGKSAPSKSNTKGGAPAGKKNNSRTKNFKAGRR